MQVEQTVLLLVYFLLIFNQYVQMNPLELSSPIDDVYKVNISNSKATLPTCISDRDCRMHGWCNDGECQCEKGWITWQYSGQCSYKQSSKMLAVILSFLVGIVGIDWFVLSRRDSLYVLCGILKLLVFTGCCVWSPLAARSKSKNATTAASCLSVSLTLISFIWWLVDWIRILFNTFPDGNGAALI